MAWLLLGILALLALGVGLAWQPMFVTFWVRGHTLTWVMGFQVHWLWWHFGDDWLIPQTPAAHASGGMSFDPSLVKDGLWVVSWYRSFLQRAWSSVRFTRCDCHATIGLGEASDTALAIGAISALLGWWLVHRILPQAGTTRPSVKVEPNWNQADFHFHLATQFWFRPSFMTVAALHSLVAEIRDGVRPHKLRRVQHGHIPGGTLGSSSHRIAHENRDGIHQGHD